MHEREDLRPGTLEEYKKLANYYFAIKPLPIHVYSSYTRMEGDWFGAGCRIETVWGLQGEDTAVMGMREEGENFETREVVGCWVNEELLKQIGEQDGNTAP